MKERKKARFEIKNMQPCKPLPGFEFRVRLFSADDNFLAVSFFTTHNAACQWIADLVQAVSDADIVELDEATP